jgi:cellulose synthase/poly-beta-1,6-N-acetylglucosamine synthase-like glycosyltransferase
VALQNLWTIVLWAMALALLAPAAVFCIECLASLLPRRRRGVSADSARPRIAVLTPAHNERAVLASTIDALRPQLAEGDIALVVADNCDDDTASVARESGAEAVERRDLEHRGKGFALDHGIDTLRDRSFDVLVVLDADCHVEPGAIDALARQVAATGRPAQAVYLMESPLAPTPRDRVSTWAFMVKNLVRPLGLARLGLPCPLTGTGMAFPREALAKVSLASANLVEDMQLGLDLALIGSAPRLCPGARVTGRLPANADDALGQRRRWEHGHLHTIFRQAPRLVLLGLARCRPAALAMALDLIVPPLSLLLVLLMVSIAVAGLSHLLLGSPRGPAMVLITATLAVMGSMFLAWLRFGRRCLPARSLPGIITYVAWKLPMYVMYFIHPEKKWVRTSRDEPHLPDPAKSPA